MSEPVIPSKVPAGGPSTITGILAQALRVLSLCVESQRRLSLRHSSSDDTEGLTLILEPASGGDIDLRSDGRREVEQIKTRSGGRTWSLQQFVEDVLPDLYRAVREGESCTYRFVTNGEIGEWTEVKEVFESWATRSGPTPAGEVDNTKVLRFVRKSGNEFWGDGPYTERVLFNRIVKFLRSRKPASEETEDLTQRKAWHLLSNLEIEAGRDFGAIQRVIETWLKGKIPAIEKLNQERDSLIADLLRRGARGDAVIDAKMFFAEHGLTARDLSDWDGHVRAAERTLRARLVSMDIDTLRDPRPELASTVIDRWRAGPPILLVTGESGQGKTWLGGSILAKLSGAGELVAFRESANNADTDTRALADTVWREIIGHDHPVPFSRIAARIEDVDPLLASQPIYLCVDGVTNATECKRLVRDVLTQKSLRLIVTCQPGVAGEIEDALGGQVQRYDVRDFSGEEIREFLSRTLGDTWAEIPADVRETLRKPLLADIYRRIASDGSWKPIREYELYERLWGRLTRGDSADHPLDPVLLGRAALQVLQGQPYPWTTGGVLGESRDDSFIPRAIKAGWLRALGQGLYQATHERLVNWAVAEGVVTAFREGKLTAATLIELLRAARDAPTLTRGPLGYVLMDVLWLLTAPGLPSQAPVIDQVIEEHEKDVLVRTETFYRELIPTLGPRILPSLIRRLRRVAAQTDDVVGTDVIAGIVALDSDGLSSEAINLLHDQAPAIRRLGARILKDRPSPDALDALWKLHCEQAKDPSPFLRWPTEHPGFVQQDTMSALHACVQLMPAWIEAALRRVEPKVPQIGDLGWLLSEVGDVVLWQRLKRTLFDKLPDDRRASFAANVEAYGDTTEAAWLEEQVGGLQGHTAALAMRALLRVDPARALSALGAMADDELRVSGHWHVHRLLILQPEATRRHLLDRISAHTSPWDLALALQGAENYMGPELLDLLLDALVPLIDAATTDASDRIDGLLFRPIHILNQVVDPELLDRIRRRRDGRLETSLTRWLTTKGPPPGTFRDALRTEGLELLSRIGGSGFTKVVNNWLAGEPYARAHAMSLAARRPDPPTLAILRTMTEGTEESDRARYNRGLAATALVRCGDLVGALHYVQRNGLKTRAAMLDQLDKHGHVNEESVAEALNGLDDETTVPGAAMVIGLSGREDLREKLYEVLDSHAPDSEAAVAAVVALGWMKDGSEAAVGYATRVLESGAHEHLAIEALWQMGTDKAHEILRQRLDREFHEGIALALLGEQKFQAGIVKRLQARLKDVTSFRRFELIQSLVNSAVPEEAISLIFEDSEIREFARESVSADDVRISTWGGQETAIRALAYFDRTAAFDAGRAALRGKGKGRERYPYRLVEFDEKRAPGALLEWAREERMDSVLWAIGRALSPFDITQQIRAMVDSISPHENILACRIAASARQGEPVRTMLRRLETNTMKSVANAASSALSVIATIELADRLADALIAEEDQTHRWALLEGLLSVVDPGDPGESLPTWIKKVNDGLPQAMRKHLREALRDRRKKIQEARQRED